MSGFFVSLGWAQAPDYGNDANNFAPTTQNCDVPVSSGDNGIVTGPAGTPGRDSFHVFDSLANQACNDGIGTPQSWFVKIATLMQNTFYLLAVLELCWAAAMWAFEQEHLTSLGAEMVKKIMFIGFFYTLLHYAPAWIPAITRTFSIIGTNTTGITASTDGIVAQGLAEIDFLWQNATKMTVKNCADLFLPYAVAALVTVAIIISSIVLAAQFFMAQVESYIMLAVGAVFLGLGANSLTKDYARKTLSYAIVVGVRLLTIILIDALVQGVIAQSLQGWQFSLAPLAKLGAVTLMQLMMAIQAPAMALALMKPGSGLTAGVVKQVFGAVASAALSVATAGVGAGARAMGGAANMVKGESGGQGGNSRSSDSVSGLSGGGGRGGSGSVGGGGGGSGGGGGKGGGGGNAFAAGKAVGQAVGDKLKGAVSGSGGGKGNGGGAG
jgi:type IV secretion system protein TrbL